MKKGEKKADGGRKKQTGEEKEDEGKEDSRTKSGRKTRKMAPRMTESNLGKASGRKM